MPIPGAHWPRISIGDNKGLISLREYCSCSIVLNGFAAVPICESSIFTWRELEKFRFKYFSISGYAVQLLKVDPPTVPSREYIENHLQTSTEEYAFLALEVSLRKRENK